eukprot:scaffold6226_cov161-Prasinococcus_capsulatus_cf.AAC.1
MERSARRQTSRRSPHSSAARQLSKLPVDRAAPQAERAGNQAQRRTWTSSIWDTSAVLTRWRSS